MKDVEVAAWLRQVQKRAPQSVAGLYRVEDVAPTPGRTPEALIRIARGAPIGKVAATCPPEGPDWWVVRFATFEVPGDVAVVTPDTQWALRNKTLYPIDPPVIADSTLGAVASALIPVS